MKLKVPLLLALKSTSNKLSMEGKIIEAFSYDIKLIHRILQQTPDINDAQQNISRILIWRNQNAMSLLQQGRKNDSKKLLFLIEKVLCELNMPFFFNLQHLVYNNISCCMKREGNLEAAIKYLEKAIEKAKSSNDDDSEALYHLNICVILSQIGNHRKAECEAKLSIAQSLKRIASTDSIESSEKNTLLAISYYNLGVQQEFLKKYTSSYDSYYKAHKTLSLLQVYDENLLKSFLNAKMQMEVKLRATKRNSIQSAAKTGSVIIKRFKYAAPIPSKKLVTGLRPLSATRSSIKSQLGSVRGSVQLKRNDYRNTVTSFKKDFIPSQSVNNGEENNSLTLHPQNGKKPRISGFDVIRQTISKQTRTTLTARPSIKEENNKESETHPLRVQIQTYRDISNYPLPKNTAAAETKVGVEIKSMQSSFHREANKEASPPVIITESKVPPIIQPTEKNLPNTDIPIMKKENIPSKVLPPKIPIVESQPIPVADHTKEVEDDYVEVYDMDKKEDETSIKENAFQNKNQFFKLTKMSKMTEPEVPKNEDKLAVGDASENQAARKLQKLFKRKKKVTNIDDAARVIQHLFKKSSAKAKLKQLKVAAAQNDKVIFKAFTLENSIPHVIIISLQNLDRDFVSLSICAQNTLEDKSESIKGNLAKLNMEQVVNIISSFSFTSVNMHSIKTALEDHIVWETENEVADNQENNIEPLIDSSLQPLGIKDEMTNEMSSLEPLNMQSSISNNNLGQIESMHSKEDEDDGQLIEASIL